MMFATEFMRKQEEGIDGEHHKIRMPEILKFEMQEGYHFVYKKNMQTQWQDWSNTEIGLRILLARRQTMVNWDFAELSAPHWRLYHCAENGASILIQGKQISLDPDALWLVPPEVGFGSLNDRPFSQLYVHFLIQARWKASAPGFVRIPLTRPMEAELHLPDAKAGSWKAGCAVQRLVLGALMGVPFDYFVPEQEDARARHLIRLMTTEPGRAWTNSTLAKEAGFHPQALVRWFRQTTGRTPRQFLLDLRIKEACLLLLFTRRTIEDIAAATGFCDRYHFTRTFQALRKDAPAAYRRQREHWPAARLGNDLWW